jgi:NAD(P)-dependent dehydrogenase (short-subunit alcohol dehydrogenase family)
MTTIVLSNNQGKYLLTHLASGSYEIWATSMGYKSDPAKRSDIKIDGRQTVALNFTMQKGIVQWNQLTRYQAGMLLPKPTSGPEAKGRDVLLQNCFGCHAMSKWGMRTDHDGWIGAIGVMRTVGVADINPDIAEQAATYLASVFGPDSDTPSSPAQLPDFKSVMQDHDSWSDDALNIEYVDYKLTGEPKDRPGSGRPDKFGNVWLEMGGGLSKLNPETGEFKTFRLDDPTRPNIHEVFPTPDGTVRAVQLDLADDTSIQEVVNGLASLGVEDLQGLVNDATGHGDAVPLEVVTRADLDAQFAVTVTGTSVLTAALLPLLRRAHGRVVNVGAGALSMPLLGTTFAAKHALEAMSDVLRIELAAVKVRVIVIEPGMTRWEDIEAQRHAYDQAVDRGVRRVRDDDRIRYQGIAKRLKQLNARMLERGAAAEDVAAMIERALTTRRPRPRYYCGVQPRLGALLSRALPAALTDRALRRLLRT